jgi:hypothetical protein
MDVYNIALHNEYLCETYVEMYKDFQLKNDIDPYELSDINSNIKPMMKMKNLPNVSTHDKCFLCNEKLFCTYMNVTILTCGHMFHQLCLSDYGMDCPNGGVSCYI